MISEQGGRIDGQIFLAECASTANGTSVIRTGNEQTSSLCIRIGNLHVLERMRSCLCCLLEVAQHGFPSLKPSAVVCHHTNMLTSKAQCVAHLVQSDGVERAACNELVCVLQWADRANNLAQAAAKQRKQS